MSQKRYILLGSSLGLILRVAGAFLAIALQISIARAIGRDAFGSYSYAISWLALLAVLGGLGFASSIPRFLPVMLSKREHSNYKGTLLIAFCLPLSLSILIATSFLAIIYGFGIWENSPYRLPMSIGLLALPALTMSRIRRSSVLALKRVMWADLPDMVCRPVFLICLICMAVLLGRSLGASGAMLLFAISATAAFIVGIIALWAMQPTDIRGKRAALQWRHVLVVSAPMYLMESMSVLIGEFAVIALGWANDPEDVAVYAVAVRLTLLIGFALQAANSVLNPVISELYHEKKQEQLQGYLTYAARMLSLVAVMMVLTLILAGRFVLGLFGPGFIEGYGILLILLIGQAVNAFAGSVGSIMKMTGHQNQSCVIMLIATAINIVLCLILIPRFGAIGAAISVALSLSAWNIFMVIYCLRAIGLNPTVFSLPMIKGKAE